MKSVKRDAYKQHNDRSVPAAAARCGFTCSSMRDSVVRPMIDRSETINLLLLFLTSVSATCVIQWYRFRLVSDSDVD